MIIAHKAVDTAMNGMRIFHRSRAAMVNGEKVVMKHRMELGSKLLTLAMLPSPKKDSSVKKSFTENVTDNYTFTFSNQSMNYSIITTTLLNF